MSTTKLDLIGRTADVVRLIKWYCSRTHVRKIECMRRCGFNSMISDVWVRMLEQFEKKDSIECDFSTYVINNSQWECSKTHQLGRRRVDFIFRMNNADSEIPESYLCIDDDIVEKIFWTDAMNAAMKVLTRRERSVLEGLYGIVGPQRTLQCIGTEHGITRERVRQIANQAISKCQHHPTLRKYMENQPNIDETEESEIEEDDF